MPKALKAQWTVVAGVIPNEPAEKFTKVWRYDSEQYAADFGAEHQLDYHAAFAKMRAEAMDYYLQVSNPQFVNWARLEFLWI